MKEENKQIIKETLKEMEFFKLSNYEKTLVRVFAQSCFINQELKELKNKK